MNGFDAEQLVARGVFDSLKELDRVMCELDYVLAEPRVTRIGWARGMDFNRGRTAHGVGEVVGSNVAPFGTAAAQPMRGSADVKQSGLCVFENGRSDGKTGGEVVASPCLVMHPESANGPRKQAPSAVTGHSLCIWCAWERASQPGPRMAPQRINGDVRLEPCARHASLSESSTQQAARASDAVPHPLPAA